jgi:hypothetical protein
MLDFTSIPEALDAVPSHTWLSRDDVPETSSSRSELRAALKRAEAQVSRLRAQLNPEYSERDNSSR